LASTLACLPRNGLGCFGAFLAVVTDLAAGFLAAGFFAGAFFAAGFLAAGFFAGTFLAAGLAAGFLAAAACVCDLVDGAWLLAEVAFLAPSGTAPPPLSPLVLALFLAAGRFGLG
jgi:hypothetical protein